MRRVVLSLFAAASVVPLGCNWLTKSKDPVKDQTGTGGKTRDGLPPRPANDFVTYLNRQAGYLQTVRYDDLNLSVSMPGQYVPSLNNGMVVCGKPNNFRMTAGLITGKQLDVGSNAQEMWMYVKPSDPQFLFCSHADFPRVQGALPVKFEPDWVLQALGMATFDTNRQYDVKPDDKNRAYHLMYPDTTATGEKVLKVTEFAGDAMSGASPQVRRHVVMTPDQKQIIAVATVKKTAEYTLGGNQPGGAAVVQIPVEVKLEWPQEKVTMDLQLGRVKLNETLTQADFDNLFRRPREISSAKPVNLAEYLSAARTGGVSRASRPDDALPRR